MYALYIVFLYPCCLRGNKLHNNAYYTADSAGRSSFIILRPDDVGADAGVSEFQQQSS